MGNISKPSDISEILETLVDECGGNIWYDYKADVKNEALDETQAAIEQYVLEDREKYLSLWRGDVETNFIPKCSYCGRKTAKVVWQTTKGKYAQEANHLPRNWGYYCQKCYDEGMELEKEAMYG